MNGAGEAAFAPLALLPGWVLERCHGWSVLEERAPGSGEGALKLLARRRGPLRTFLLLARGAPSEELDRIARRHGVGGPLSVSTLADFEPGDAPVLREIGGRAFLRVDAERWFGVGTFVVDLAESEDALWKRVSARERSKCRQAQRAGVHVALGERPDEQELRGFLALYGRMARQRGLEPLSLATLLATSARGELLLARARDAAGATLVANLAWRAHGQGYFLYGARAGDVAAGAGHLAQWETLRHLKASGARFYDLGLVRSTDESDGLYRFKRSLGGRFVPFGAEYRRVPLWLQAGYDSFQRVRARRRRRGREDAGDA